jgi:hypothetical protein
MRTTAVAVREEAFEMHLSLDDLIWKLGQVSG